MTSAFFDARIVPDIAPDVRADGVTPVAATPAPRAAGATARVASRRSRSLRPLVVPAASATSMLAVGAVRAVPFPVIALMLVVSLGQLARVRRTPRVAPWSSAPAVARGLGSGVVACMVVLYLLHAERAVIDGVLVSGVVTVAVATLVAAVVAAVASRPRTVVVGDSGDVSDLLGRWAGREHLDVVATRTLGGGAPASSPSVVPGPGLPVLPPSVPLASWVAAHDVDVVLVASGSTERAEEVRRLGWELADSPAALVVVDSTRHVSPHRLSHEVLDGTTMTVVQGSGRGSRWVKSVGDRVLSIVLVALFAPFVALLVLAVRLDSPGPALYRQTRVGRDGRTFTLLKLRTMTVDADEVKTSLLPDDGNGLLFKIRLDPRVTRVGRVLRAFSLDELPQLWNVVRGHMSLVGPRPALPEEVARYSDLERRRLAVKPGLTGPWQVGGRSTLSRERSMQLDVGYADNWRPSGDVRILLRTIDAVITRRGAY